MGPPHAEHPWLLNTEKEELPVSSKLFGGQICTRLHNEEKWRYASTLVKCFLIINHQYSKTLIPNYRKSTSTIYQARAVKMVGYWPSPLLFLCLRTCLRIGLSKKIYLNKHAIYIYIYICQYPTNMTSCSFHTGNNCTPY